MKESPARKRILDAASRLFYDQGYNSTGINQIIDEADIARGSLYKFFPSKRDLLTAYIQNAEDVWFDQLDVFLEPVKDPKAKLLAMFDYRIERQIRSNFGGCQFIKIGAEVPKEDEKAFELIRHQKDRIKDYIGNLLDGMTLRSNSHLTKGLLVETLFMIMEGATISASVYKDLEALEKAKEIVEKLLS